MLKSAKRGALHALNRLGVFPRVRDSTWRRAQLLILCYHGIALDDEHKWDSSLYMSAQDFESRLRLIEQGGHTVLPLGLALDRLYSNTLPERSVAITFDDGTYDFMRQAYPLLQKYGFPATVYLTTYYCENNRPVFPGFCSYLLWKARDTVIDAAPITGETERWDLRTESGRARAQRSMLRFADESQLGTPGKTELLEQLAGALGLDYAALVATRVVHILTPNEVSVLARNGVDFQLHTHRHRTPIDQQLFRKEIEDNRRSLSDAGQRALHFCYPSGVYWQEFLPWLRTEKVLSATTCDAGLASVESNPLLLPRLVDTSARTPIEFEGWLTGVGALLAFRKTAPRIVPAAAGHASQVADQP